MADVFVSYARPDEPQAERVANALRDQGYHVWRDDELPAHRSYSEVIEERLKSAKAVVVLWSADSAKSQWVRAEADAARSAGTLVQAALDGTIPPMPFNQIQCADLSNWGGNGDSPGWRKLQGSVAALTGEAVVPSAQRVKPRQLSVCVLPFANMSGDSEQEYFSDGISEDITTDLSKVSALSVTARNTAFQFKGQSVDVCEVARRLAVSHVLEGSVRKAGARLRITAQLIDGATGAHVWADRYDRDLTDIFAIQDEISKAIVDALRIKLLPQERKAIEKRGTDNVEAYNLYLMARRYWISGNWGDVRQLELVQRICRRALEIDPVYARVWGLLAIIQCLLHFAFNASDDNGMAAASRALELDPTIAEAYCVRARQHYETGKLDQADRDLERALHFGPDSWEVNREAARIYYFQRRFSEAARHYEKSVELDDGDYHSWGMLASTYEALGDEDAARHAAKMLISKSERVLQEDPTNGSALGQAGYGIAMLGERERFDDWLERAMLLNPENVFMRYNFACILEQKFKDHETALDLLESIMPQLSPSIIKATSVDPDFDGLHDHPRWKLMMDRAEEARSSPA